MTHPIRRTYSSWLNLLEDTIILDLVVAAVLTGVMHDYVTQSKLAAKSRMREILSNL